MSEIREASKQLAFFFDQTRCIGCYTCVVACKDWHDIPAGPINWRRVFTIERGNYPTPFIAFLSISCVHCAEPPCELNCPSNAITKRKIDGVVVVDREACLGKDTCGICLEVCPNHAPQFGDEKNSKMQMCNFCLDRWQDGKKPACVDGCPMRAMDAGTYQDIKEKYGEKKETVGFINDKLANPSIIFKAKIHEQSDTF